MKRSHRPMLAGIIGVGIIISSSLGWCSIPSVSKPLKIQWSHFISAPIYKLLGYRELKVHVIDSDTLLPIENALIMIGDQDQSPIEKNWLFTDRDGNVAFDGFLLPQGGLTITAAHENYGRFTIVESEATEINLSLSPLEDTSPKSLIEGSFTEFPPMKDRDGIVEVGIFLPFTDLVSLLSFSTDRLLAPYVKAYIYKEVSVPGNLVIPDQEEVIMGLFPVYVSKPTYQMPFVKNSIQNFVALEGAIPFGKFASGIINKQPLPTILNLISLNQMGMIRGYGVPEEDSILDIPLNFQLKPKYNIQVTSGPIQKDIIYLSVGSFKNDMNRFFPMDFKLSSRDDQNKTALLKSLPSLPPLNELIFVLASDLPKNTSDPRKLDTSILGVAKRPMREGTIYIQSFLNPRDLAYQESVKKFSIQERRSEELPPKDHLQISFLNLRTPGTSEQKGHSELLWTIVTPSTEKEFTLPSLPKGLSDFPSLKPKQELEWISNTFGFNEKDQSFDYNNFNPSTFTLALTHLSQNHMQLSKSQE